VPNIVAMEQIVCQQCGSVGDYRTELRANQLTAWCNSCNGFLKNLAQGKPRFFIGKYKGDFIHEVTDLSYLKWFQENIKKQNAGMRKALTDRISELEYTLR
jgi:hypothetical protein